MVPLIAALLPIGLGCYALAFDSTAVTWLMPWAVFVLGSHGCFSSIMTLALYTPYRNYINNIFQRITKGNFRERAAKATSQQHIVVHSMAKKEVK